VGANNKKLTLDQYKLQALEHGSRCIAKEYLGVHISILHQCLKDPSHEWVARPNVIKHDHGCPHCAGNIKSTLDQYKKQIKDKNVICIAEEYLGTKTPILHQCLKDPSHEWMASPCGIKQDEGCPHCAGNIKLTLDQYKEQIKDKNVICIADEYINDNTSILHQCLKDPSHEWMARPNAIKHGCGCPYCAGNIKPTLDQYKEQIKDKNVICIAEEYLDTKTPILHQCLKDPSHEWMVRPNDIKYGYGCPYCVGLKRENLCRDWLENKFQKRFPKSKPKWLLNRHTNYCLELDGYCEKLKIAFEYNGEQHYKPCRFFGDQTKENIIKRFERQQFRDALKSKLCIEHGVRLVVVPYWEKNIEVFLEKQFADPDTLKS
jgi:hypothetical protein